MRFVAVGWQTRVDLTSSCFLFLRVVLCGREAPGLAIFAIFFALRNANPSFESIDSIYGLAAANMEILCSFAAKPQAAKIFRLTGPHCPLFVALVE